MHYLIEVPPRPYRVGDITLTLQKQKPNLTKLSELLDGSAAARWSLGLESILSYSVMPPCLPLRHLFSPSFASEWSLRVV